MEKAKIQEKISNYKKKLDELSNNYLCTKYSKEEIEEILKQLGGVKSALAELLKEVVETISDSEVRNEGLNFLVLQMINSQIKSLDNSIFKFQKFCQQDKKREG